MRPIKYLSRGHGYGIVVAHALVAPRFVCCTSAAAVGGIASMDLALVLNICFLAKFCAGSVIQ